MRRGMAGLRRFDLFKEERCFGGRPAAKAGADNLKDADLFMNRDGDNVAWTYIVGGFGHLAAVYADLAQLDQAGSKGPRLGDAGMP